MQESIYITHVFKETLILLAMGSGLITLTQTKYWQQHKLLSWVITTRWGVYRRIDWELPRRPGCYSDEGQWGQHTLWGESSGPNTGCVQSFPNSWCKGTQWTKRKSRTNWKLLFKISLLNLQNWQLIEELEEGQGQLIISQSVLLLLFLCLWVTKPFK